jgi:hypothetical protein
VELLKRSDKRTYNPIIPLKDDPSHGSPKTLIIKITVTEERD